jgi:hypothetical protein
MRPTSGRRTQSPAAHAQPPGSTGELPGAGAPGPGSTERFLLLSGSAMAETRPAA